MKQNLIKTISAVAVGATVMHYLDPEQGRRRRALVRDRVVSASLHGTAATRAHAKRVANRAKGWTSRLAARFSSTREPPTPRQLQNRIRSHVGRLVSHPRAVNVEVVSNGRVRLSGDVLENELDVLLTGVENVAGVTHVESQLTAHESAGAISETEDGSHGRERREGRGRLWRTAFALMAPVAILAATARPASRRRGIIERLSSNRRGLPSSWRPRHRRYLSALRIS